MKPIFQLEEVEEFIAGDANFLFTIVSFAMVLVFFLNHVFIHSIIVGVISSLVFLFLNTVFLGYALFKNEVLFLRFMLGGLVLLFFLGVVGWVVMIAYNLDTLRSTIALCILAGVSSAINRVKQREGKKR